MKILKNGWRFTMNNISKIVNLGVCTGCNACSSCEHIIFVKNQYGVYSPVVDDDKCTDCGKCVAECIYAPNKEDEDN